MLGNILPLLIAVIAVPVIAQQAGLDRLGALGMVWALVGYFGFLDFGLSRVVTRRVAQAVQQQRLCDELTELRGFLWWWALPTLLLVTVALVALLPLIVPHLPAGELGQEVARGWGWMMWSIPVTLATNWLRGALEGLERFARVNILRTVFGSWTYAAPAAVLFITPTLDAMIIAIAAGRLLALVAHVAACLQVERAIIVGPTPCRARSVPQFFQEGGWITISSVVSPLMVYFDRFLLASMLPVRAVAWYVTAQEVMLRTVMIPASLAGVLFPKFAGATGMMEKMPVLAMYRRGIRSVSALMLPLCVAAAAGAYDAMRFWMGEDFALNSHQVVEIVAIGVFFNSIAQLPFAWLQGVGRADLTAKLHMAELPVYAAGLYFCVAQWGILGAAAMWALRVSADCIVLLRMAVPQAAGAATAVGAVGALLIGVTGLLSGPEWSWQWRLMIGCTALSMALAGAWLGLLDRDDRHNIVRFRDAH